ncbi:MAG: cell division protein FtsZ [Bacteroidales bacterium]|nr:cell division protein FtsZ [Bacteroidales bacterium]
MMDDNMIIAPPDWATSDEIIKVLGVGGGGCNAVTYMYNLGIKGCSFVVCNTDAQALQRSSVPMKLQMGQGLGAGTDPIKGRNAALDSQDQIQNILDKNTRMLFITAGMGGGTGTGATPVIAKMSKDKGILTVGVVTLPFRNEGSEVLSRAIDGIHELEKNVDSLLIINNEKLYEYFGDLLIQDAFPKADEVLATAVRGIIEIIKKPGYINVDFEDVKTMMKGSGMALMGCGTGSGPDRIDQAVKEAFESPLLNDFDLKTAKNVLINITTGNNEKGLKMNDLNLINQRISEHTGNANNFKRGLIWDDDPEIGDTIHITAIATGFKFNSLIGPDINLGNIIRIPKDFVYDKNEMARTDGIILYENTSSHIGYSTKENLRIFDFDLDQKPALVVSVGESLSELENVPAIRRNQQ